MMKLMKNLKIIGATIGFSILVVALLGVSIIAIPVLAVVFVVFITYLVIRVLYEDVDINDFTYPGPKPFSKETAILMMCDSVEAASKSLKEPTSTKINDFVENIINKQMEGGQFLNADITFKEIQSIKKVLKHKLANIYHLRIEYPE